MVNDPNEFDTPTAEAARILGVQSHALSMPKYGTLSRCIRGRKAYYRRADLDAFLSAAVRTPALAKLYQRRSAVTMAASE